MMTTNIQKELNQLPERDYTDSDYLDAGKSKVNGDVENGETPVVGLTTLEVFKARDRTSTSTSVTSAITYSLQGLIISANGLSLGNGYKIKFIRSDGSVGDNQSVDELLKTITVKPIGHAKAGVYEIVLPLPLEDLQFESVMADLNEFIYLLATRDIEKAKVYLSDDMEGEALKFDAKRVEASLPGFSRLGEQTLAQTDEVKFLDLSAMEQRDNSKIGSRQERKESPSLNLYSIKGNKENTGIKIQLPGESLAADVFCELEKLHRELCPPIPDGAVAAATAKPETPHSFIGMLSSAAMSCFGFRRH